MPMLAPQIAHIPAHTEHGVAVSESSNWDAASAPVTPLHFLGDTPVVVAGHPPRSTTSHADGPGSNSAGESSSNDSVQVDRPCVSGDVGRAGAAGSSASGTLKQFPSGRSKKVFATVLFPTNSSHVAAKYYPALSHLPKAGCYTAVGHADPRGTAQYNLRLSYARAEAVAHRMSLDGLSVQWKGVGERDASSSPASWPHDRRVVIYAAHCPVRKGAAQ